MKKLIAAALELNELFGLDPAIPVKKISVEELIEKLHEAAKWLEEGDQLTEQTASVLKSIGVDIDAPEEEEDDDDEEEVVEDEEEEEEEEILPEKKKPAPKKSSKPAVVEEEEEEEEIEEEEIEEVEEDEEEVVEVVEDEEEDEGPDYSDLIIQIKKTSKMELPDRIAALKKIVKSNSVFAPMVKSVAGKFDAEQLRSSMLELLVKSEMKAVAPKKEEPKVESKPEPKVTKAAAVKEAAVKKVAPKKEAKAKTESYTRVDSVCEALKTKPKSIEDWAASANKLMLSNGGQPNLNEAKFIIRYIVKMVKHFDFGVNVPME